MGNEEKAPRKRIFSEEQKAELFNGREPTVGVPLGSTPLGGTPLGGTPLGGTPLGGTPLGGTPLGGTPLGGTPLGGTPLVGTPLGGTPLGGTPLGGTPLGGTPPLAKADSPKIEEEILIRVQFKANLETQYLLNCICKKKKMSRDRFMAEMIHQEAKKENIVISIHL